MLNLLARIFAIVLFVMALPSNSLEVSGFLPEGERYATDITKPEAMLGFEVGQRHVRHDQVLQYLQHLAESSPRIKLEEMGKTTQLRSQVLLTISSEQNLANLDEILHRRQALNSTETDPVVVWLGYSVHGDEISGTNAAMVIAYHLAASQSAQVQQMLSEMIIVIEPSINPDGMDRFVNWVNTHRGITDNPSSDHIEHHQGWRTGRTNHFGFDLNRDWLLVSQQETQNRLPYFHRFQPNVLGDFHEMGANGSYFFQPGIPTRTHPLTPAKNTQLTQLIAEFHAKALDSQDRLYYSEENFDDFYYGKGSTYPDINGAVGILFEQASSRGMQQNTVNGLLTFEYGIQNHVLTSLSTLEGAWKNKAELAQYRDEFYQLGLQQAKDENFNGYIVSEASDSYRMNAFLAKLKQHQIQAYPLMKDFTVNGELYGKTSSYYIPLEQTQYRVIKALFSQQQSFQDNTFYDVSGWTFPLAMNIKFARVGRTWGLETSAQAWQQATAQSMNVGDKAYAYVFEWQNFLAPKLLNKLSSAGIKAKVATKPFSAKVGNQVQAFEPGSILVPAANQTQADWQQTLITLASEADIPLLPLATGLTVKGIDLGSSSFRPVSPAKVLLVGGKGTSQYEAAEVLFYLDKLLAMPVTVVEQQRLARVNLAKYSHVIMVDGRYGDLSGAGLAKLKSWVINGGTVFAQKRAARWLSENELLKMDFISKEHLDQLFDTDKLTYADREQLAGRKRIAGAIFAAQLDTSHPLAYGYQSSLLPVFRNSTVMMEQTNVPFVTVAKYTQNPLLSGYTDQNLVNRLANQPTFVAHNLGKGRVIASTDNFAFRGYFLGSMKLLANSIFFSKAFNVAPPSED